MPGLLQLLVVRLNNVQPLFKTNNSVSVLSHLMAHSVCTEYRWFQAGVTQLDRALSFQPMTGQCCYLHRPSLVFSLLGVNHSNLGTRGSVLHQRPYRLLRRSLRWGEGS